MRIDLRKEFGDILTTGEGAGRWIVVRHFSNEKSEYWDEITKESVGGPGYKYIDQIVEAYSTVYADTIFRNNQGMVSEQPGLISQPLYRFYVHHDVDVSDNDDLFDLDYYEATKPNIVYDKKDEHFNSVMMKTRYKVRRVDVFRDWQGRVEYLKVLADKVVGR